MWRRRTRAFALTRSWRGRASRRRPSPGPRPCLTAPAGRAPSPTSRTLAPTHAAQGPGGGRAPSGTAPRPARRIRRDRAIRRGQPGNRSGLGRQLRGPHVAQCLAGGHQIGPVGALPELLEVGPSEHEVGAISNGRPPEPRGRGDRLFVAPLIVELAGELETPPGHEPGGRTSAARSAASTSSCAKPLQSRDLCALTARHLI